MKKVLIFNVEIAQKNYQLPYYNLILLAKLISRKVICDICQKEISNKLMLRRHKIFVHKSQVSLFCDYDIQCLADLTDFFVFYVVIRGCFDPRKRPLKLVPRPWAFCSKQMLIELSNDFL